MNKERPADELFEFHRADGVEIVEPPLDRPWGLRDYQIRPRAATTWDASENRDRVERRSRTALDWNRTSGEHELPTVF